MKSAGNLKCKNYSNVIDFSGKILMQRGTKNSKREKKVDKNY